MAPRDAAPPPDPEDTEAAFGRAFGVGTSYGAAALRLFDNGYAPLPIKPGTKRPTLTAWSTVAVDETSVTEWARDYPDWGVGLRTGSLVGIGIDVPDPDLAHRIYSLVDRRLGATLMRVGRWPKRLLAYRTEAPFTKFSIPRAVEFLASGQQFVAFGIHPDTGRAYHWPLGDTPLDVPLSDLPPVDVAGCQELLAEIADLLPERSGGQQRSGRSQQAGRTPRPERDERGLVVDGRDAWLSLRLGFLSV